MSTTLFVNKKGFGFTLIELLITVSIIAVLSTIGIISYSNFLKNTRDSKRLSDLKIIQSALESYHADQIYYPLLATDACPAAGDGKLRIGCALTNTTGSKTYLTKIPNDPKGGTEYSYVSLPSGCNNTSTLCTSYCLYTQIEGTPPKPAVESGCTLSGSYGYGVTRP